MSKLQAFEPYLRKWQAEPDGEPISTPSSCLLPVTVDGRAGMIKLARPIEEQLGGAVMAWWGGYGAAPVYARDPQTGALLMARAMGSKHLLRMALSGADDEATQIVCQTIAQLHEKRIEPEPKGLYSLDRFFESLAPMAEREGDLLATCHAIATELLSSQRERVVLHGDAHHSNILDFSERGWLAIDPKGVVGERYYDYVNVLCNPDLPTCVEPKRFGRQLDLVCTHAKLDRTRLLQWVMAHAGLSAAWFLEDGEREKADTELLVARLAKDYLGLD